MCNCYDGRVRCTEQATAYLIHPDGTRNPGGWVCPRHGEEITVEYQQKLGESWGLEPIQDESAPGTRPAAPVRYSHYDPGYGTVEGFHSWTLTAPIGEHPEGDTLSERTINALGYEIPESERPPERFAELDRDVIRDEGFREEDR